MEFNTKTGYRVTSRSPEPCRPDTLRRKFGHDTDQVMYDTARDPQIYWQPFIKHRQERRYIQAVNALSSVPLNRPATRLVLLNNKNGFRLRPVLHRLAS